MSDRAPLRAYYDGKAVQAKSDKQYAQRTAQLGALENTMIDGFNAVIKTSTRTTKTEVVNHPKSISTPDVQRVVEAVDALPEKLKKNNVDVQKVAVENLNLDKLSEAISSLSKVEGKKGNDGKDGNDGSDGKDGADGRDGKDGRPVKLRSNDTHIQYQYDGDIIWKNLVSLVSLRGRDGYTPVKGVDYFDAIGKDGNDAKELELRKTKTQLQWRHAGGKWQILAKLSELKGDAAKHVGGGGGGPGIVKAVIAGTGISIDSTDVYNPIISTTGGGGMADPGANGMVVRTALNTTSARTLTGTTNQITVTNGDGVSGNPTLSLPSAITTPGSLTITGHNSPQANSTYTLGTSSLYWSNTYTDRLYLNSTAYLDGGTAGAVGITGNVGIGTTTPAHFLDVSKTVNSRTAYGINSTMTASTLQSDVASTGNDETFTNSHYAWKFVASAAHTVGSISVRLKKVGTVTNTTDTIQLKIFSDNAGTPDALLMTTDSIKMGTLTTSYVEYLFGGELTLVNGTTYWIALRKSAAVTGGGSIAIDRNGMALTTCNTATPVSGDWTVNAGLGWYTVYGRSPIGIKGASTNTIGIYGVSTNAQGVQGISTNSVGVQGSSTNYVGVQGNSTNSSGVNGSSTNNIGVNGTSTNSVGVYGTSTNYFGVYGTSTNSYGALLTQSGTLTAANSFNAALVRRNGVTNSTGSLNYSGNVLQITDSPTGTGTVSGALISGSLSVASDGSGTTERIRFDPRVANGASAVAHMLDTGNALSTAGALLLDVRNNGISKHAVDLNGNIIEKVPTTPASATAAGVQGTICWDADYVYVCVATNTWKRSALGSW